MEDFDHSAGDKVINDCHENQEEKQENLIEIEIPFELFQYLSSGNCNLDNVCRLCLSTSNEIMYPLVATKDERFLGDILLTLTSIQLNADDGLPSNICEGCQTQILQWYDFKIRSEKSDFTLRSVLTGNFIAKDGAYDINLNKEIKNEPTPENEVTKEVDINEENQYLDELKGYTATTNKKAAKQIKKKRKASTKGAKNHSKDVDVDIKEVKRKSKCHICPFCSKKFSKLIPLKVHMRNSHGDTAYPFSCKFCEESFKSEHDVQLHTILHSKGPPWTCRVCKKVFDSLFPLRRHIARHMDTKRYTCDTCGKTFVELYALRRHIRVHTGEIVEKKHACQICDKKYSEHSQLAVHMNCHTGKKPYTCSVCGKAFATMRLLRSHRLVHSDAKPYACTYCDKRFRHESTRNTHHRTHTGEKPYVCYTCGKTFIQNSNLTLHMRTHTGEKPYSCTQCDRKFTSGSSLKSHERRHAGERPHQCGICGKRFANTSMKAHMRKHTGDRPFECAACHKRFLSAAQLRDHQRTHTGERPYECAKCPQTFTSKHYLIKHLKHHEPGKCKKRRHAHKRQAATNKTYVNTKKDNQIILVNNQINDPNIQIQGQYDAAVAINSIQETPIEVTGGLLLQNDGNIKTEFIVLDNGQNLADGVNYVTNDDMNLVTVNESGEVSISASSAVLETTTVKLDQSLVQIHTSGGHLTISKITSKMTANF